MALRPFISRQNLPCYAPTFLCCQKSHFKHKEMLPQKIFQSNISRRITLVGSVFLASDAIFRPENAFGLDMMRMAGPEPTIELAESGIRGHAESLLGVKALLESESWREAQKELRKSSSNLKLDIYTIIQSKPGNERPLLRKLYFDLFNNVTKLDYAARDKDASRVWQCYGNIVAALDDILGRI